MKYRKWRCRVAQLPDRQPQLCRLLRRIKIIMMVMIPQQACRDTSPVGVPPVFFRDWTFREYLARSSSGLPPCILEHTQNPVFLFPARMCLVRRHLNSYLTSALSCLSPKTVAVRPANLTRVHVLPLTTSLPRDMSLPGRGDPAASSQRCC